MCGFCGIAEIGGAVDPVLIQRMGDSLAHRGPDQGGVFLHSGGALGVGLATRRLAILDLSSAGDQPMQTPDGRFCIAYNGELYNEPELRRELEARGHHFRSRSDTETVLHAFQAFGPEALDRFNGMFALAVFDRERQELMLARDRMGIKPLYYLWDGRRLVFASELRTLLGAAGVPRQVDGEALELYLAFGYVPSPFSLIRGVRKLPPGSHLRLDARGEPRIANFWWPTYPPLRGLDRARAAEAVRETVTAAVERQMRSDVPVGVLLSGGIDSTIVATCAAAATEQPLHTFSIAFESARSPIQDFYNSDAHYARRVAATLGAEHHELVWDEAEDTEALLRRLVVGLDEPVWELSFVSIYLMSRLARECGVKVLLTGDGSDELFAGYPWVAAAWRQRLYERLPLLGIGLAGLVRLAPAGSRLRQHAVNLVAIRGQDDVTRYEWSHAIFDRAERRALTGHARRIDLNPVADLLAPLLVGARDRTWPDRLAMLDLALWVREHFNQRVDRMTMLNSVEARVPFQDNAVVDLALALPFSTKASGTEPKRLLKQAFRATIPEFVLRRPKRPFAAPMWAWAVGGLRGLARETLSEERLRATGLVDPRAARRALVALETPQQDRSTFKLWALIMLQLWAEGLGVRRPASPVDAGLLAASQVPGT